MFTIFLLITSCALTTAAVSDNPCPEEWAHFQNQCYRVPLGKYSFAQAYEVCQNMISHPVIITTDEEQGYVEDIFFRAIGRNLWTSGVRIGPGSTNSFRWLNGQPFSYYRWAKGQPDNHGGSEYCVLLSNGPVDTGLWHDVRCEQKHNVLCQRKVKGSESDKEFGDMLKDLYRKYHPVADSNFRFYTPFMLSFGVIASMFSTMLIVFLVIIKFLSSTKLVDEPVSNLNNNNVKVGGENGVVNKGFV